MRIPITEVGSIGLVLDRPYDKIPLNAWTAARNIRFRDGAAEKMLGHSESFASPSIAPYWLLPVSTVTTQFWLYGGLLKVGATDGSTHADISRAAGGNYATDLNIGWTGTVMNGIPVISNGVDLPQMWNTPALATPLTALTAWPAATTCGAMRSLKRYLVALDITKSGTRFPFAIKWSHEAPAGGLPTSWDQTDPTVNAGEYELPAGGGFVIDGHPLRDSLVIYKEYETWLMQFVGGIDVFRFNRVFSSFGSFARRCAIEFFGGQQLVFTGDDIVVHDSQQSRSILDERALRLIRGAIDSTYYRRSFVVMNPVEREVWICVPEPGHNLPNRAIVWNWKTDTIGVRDLPNTPYIAAGVVDPIQTGETWASAVGGWNTDSAAWGDRSFSPGQRALLMADPMAVKLQLLNESNLFDGAPMVAFLERTNLGFPLRSDKPPDFTTVKQVRGIWPRISGDQGGVVNVSVGSQQVPHGPISWKPARAYKIGTTDFIDVLSTGRLHAIKFESSEDLRWKLHDYDVDVRPVGVY